MMCGIGLGEKMDPTKKELYTAKRSSGVDCSDPRIIEMWERVKDDHDPIQWLLIGYLNSSTVVLIQSGERFDEMLSYMNDDECLFGALRGKVSGADKFFSLSFVGENVNGMKKGKASMHKSAVLNLFEVHGSITLSGQCEANPTVATQQISQQFRVSQDLVEI
jgi:hypothetical protein